MRAADPEPYARLGLKLQSVYVCMQPFLSHLAPFLRIPSCLLAHSVPPYPLSLFACGVM